MSTGSEPADTGGKPDVTIPEGAPPTDLQIEDLVVGDGEEAVAPTDVKVHYVGVSWSPASSSTRRGTAGRSSGSASAADRSSAAGTRASRA